MRKQVSGFNTHRLRRDESYYKLECLFHDKMNNNLEFNSNFLSSIVYRGENYLTEHEERIVMSVVQWLGTPVGQSFLKSVELKASIDSNKTPVNTSATHKKQKDDRLYQKKI